MVVVALVAWFVTRGSPTGPQSPTSDSHSGTTSVGQHEGTAHGGGGGGGGTTLVASMARWQLPSPLSRAGAAPLPGHRVMLLGGLTASDTSSSHVDVLDTASGALTQVATLASPTHDAGSTTLGGNAYLFGGGQSASFSLVQAVPLTDASSSGGTAPAAVTGQLPTARSDGGAVTIGSTAYVVGGYDGTTGDAQVLATTDGSSFSPVVTLPVAVRYASVAQQGGIIYVFGGESQPGGSTQEYSTPTGTTTPPPGQEVAVVQAVNTRTRTAHVVGYLPHAVEGAAAFVLGGHIFLAGGDSQEQGASPNSGSTIWTFDPSTDKFHVAGHLASPVSYAAVAVEGHTAWLVGGERNGAVVASAQKLTLGRTR